MGLARFKSVAEIKIPDTELCVAAVDLLESCSPDFLCQHCLRTYVFGSLAIKGIGREVQDVEAAFCAAMLHDLGLVRPNIGVDRFEISGADAARKFCEQHSVSPERVELVWEAIALHTTAGVAARMASEIALCHLGAGMELFGFGLDKLPPEVVEEIIDKYPRLNFKNAFRDLIVEQCRRNPAAEILTWADDVARTAGCTIHGDPIPTATQLMAAAPFEE
jgi:hypothetical protein